MAEDFGRLVVVEHPKFRLYVAVASGHDGDDSWQAFTSAEVGGLSGLFSKRERQRAAEELLDDVERELREDPYTSDLQSEGSDGA